MNKNLNQIRHKTKLSLSQFLNLYQNSISKPVFKFLASMIFGIIKHKHIHLAKISRALNESIVVKKTNERLSYHLGKKGLYKTLFHSHLNTIASQISDCRFIIYDDSDVIKPYAKKIQGLSKVRDASKSNKDKTVTGNGFLWGNLLGITQKDEKIIPIRSEIISPILDEDCKYSTNKKFLSIIQEVSPVLNKKQILVLDRGFDRITIIEPLVKAKRDFIIRMTSKRHLHYKGENLPIKQVCKKADLNYTYTVNRIHKQKIVKRNFQVGALKVYLPTEDKKGIIDKAFWLVVAKEVNKGYSWFLSTVEAETEKEIVELVMKGYQYRWKIEEFHRQVKQDYCIEDILYQRYEAIQNISAILTIIMSFLAQFSKIFIFTILKVCKLLEKNRIKDIPVYYYYRLAEAFKILFLNNFINFNPVLDTFPEEPSLFPDSNFKFFGGC